MRHEIMEESSFVVVFFILFSVMVAFGRAVITVQRQRAGLLPAHLHAC
jgi:hypothetical protein